MRMAMNMCLCAKVSSKFSALSLAAFSALLLISLAFARPCAAQTPAQTPAQSSSSSTSAAGQQPTPSTASPNATPAAGEAQQAGNPAAQNSPEMSTKDEAPTLRVRSNLVLVRVVVRDANGRAVGGLTKDDFKLFDEKQERFISEFTAEAAGPAAPASPAPPANTPAGENAAEGDVSGLPQRYVGLYFDDIHITMQDLQPVRVAALRYVRNGLRPSDRAGLFTSSGQFQVDFTADHAKIIDAIDRLIPRSLYTRSTYLCPDIEPYQAWLITTMGDPAALDVAAREVLHCDYNDNSSGMTRAEAQASESAVAELEQSNNEETYAMRGLDGLVRRMQVLPGVRTIVLISPGFLNRDDLQLTGDLIDRALRGQVVINSLDARGLYTPASMSGDISQDSVVSGASEGPRAIMEDTASMVYSEPLEEIAHGTGGVLFQNSNDMDAGFRMTGGMPEAAYLLGFVPYNTKADGSFRHLTVKLANPAFKSYKIQTRPGYFAPKAATDPQAAANDEISEAIFSQQPLDELPLQVHTSFYGGNGGKSVLTAVTHLDVKTIHFVRASGRNNDQLTLVTAVFDSNGNYVNGQQKKIDFKLLDPTLARLRGTGITLRASFDNIAPGRYVVRAVARENNGPLLGAASRTVDVP